ncbi:MAG: hypothetical protein ACKOSO_02265, partial [Actinomycetota bacterium]
MTRRPREHPPDARGVRAARGQAELAEPAGYVAVVGLRQHAARVLGRAAEEARELGGQARVERGGAAPVLAHAGQVGALHGRHAEPPAGVGVLALGHPPEQDLAARVA